MKLIQTSIEHFLAPNLALLMDKLDGSGMEDLGPTIYKRLHDNSWEVRDSVLELVHSMVELSDESELSIECVDKADFHHIFFCFAEFPPFQNHILENKICQTVEIIARNDSESYVRASAFKVLASMIKIRLFWDQALHDMDVKVLTTVVILFSTEILIGIYCRNMLSKYWELKPKESSEGKQSHALCRFTAINRFHRIVSTFSSP